jgi:DNA-binding MarR family transcriptional regulator
MTTPPPITGQDIGMAQNATRALLDDLLAGVGTDFEEWVTLLMIIQNGGQMGVVAMADTIGQALTLAADPVRRLIRRTAARGLIREEFDGYVLTDLGAQTYRRLTDEMGQLTAKLYAGFDQADLEATGRVLREVTKKARAMA